MKYRYPMLRFIQIYGRCYHDNDSDIAMQFAFRSDRNSEKFRSAPNRGGGGETPPPPPPPPRYNRVKWLVSNNRGITVENNMYIQLSLLF